MSVSVVAETLFLACIYMLYHMFYMYHVTVRNKVVLYIVLFRAVSSPSWCWDGLHHFIVTLPGHSI